MFDLIGITINIGVIGYLIFSIFTGGLQSFSNNYIFIGYLIFSILTLPNLLSRVIFKSRLFGMSSALLFVYYPIQFLLQLLIGHLTGLSLNEILPFGVIFNVILWNILFMFFIIGDNKSGNESEEILKEIISALIPAVLFTILVFIFIRQKNSIIALDYLQHLTVPNKIFNNGILCILPGQCSNLFLQHGYTTFYYIILGNIVTFLGNDPIKTFYVLDIVFPLVASIPVYMIFKKITRSTLWSQLGVLLSLLVFVMGGYDFVFFIPQTFALYLFILIFREKRLSTFQLILISILLIYTHFIIGTLFVIYLWFRQLVINNLKNNKEKNIFLLLLLLSTMFFVLANVAGFSVEKLIQQDAVKVIGSLTNPYYPNNTTVYSQILGGGWLLVLIAYLSTLFEKKKSDMSITLLAYISFGIILYFLAPTYANKFTIGAGFFSSLLIVQYLWKLGFKPILKLFLFLALVSLYSLNFFVQYNRYQAFYTQEDGTVSAIVKEDLEVVKYIEENNLVNTYIISDPYTQLIVASLGNVDTAHAQYMSLETRSALLEYLQKPTVETYENLLLSPGIPGRKDISILYTFRLERSLKLDDSSWIYNIYSLPLDNSYTIGIVPDDLLNDQKRLDKELIYISDNFILFK
jgi:hypothetical protein